MGVAERISLLSLYEVQQKNLELFASLGIEVVIIDNDNTRLDRKSVV